MPNVNLTDSRSRDAVVKAETTGVIEEVRYVDDEGQSAQNRKILKATVEHDFDTLVAKHEGDAEALGKALVDADPEVDMEICGLFLWGVSKVFVNSSDGIVYRIEQSEIVRGPSGKVKEERARERAEANIDTEIPLTWTGRKIAKDDAVRRFVFSSKLQIVHINGLTYDFLYGMAKELAEENALMMVGGGSKGRDPLVFRRGSVPYRGFLEGRVEGDKYILLLHLSNLELKVPSETKKEIEEEKAAPKEAEAKAEKKKAKTEDKKDKAVVEVEDKPKKTKKTATPVEEVPAEAAAKEETPKKKEKVAAKKVKDERATEESKVAKTKAEKKPSAKKEPEKESSEKPAASGYTTSEDLGIWLKSVRMGKYLQLFIENEIDVDVLADLSDSDLKELDIPVGSRKRLLKAVEETDNLHAEVAMAVKAMSSKSVDKSDKQKAAKQKK